jgi:hypothetical protein
VTRPVREYLAALDQAMEANAARNDNDDFPPGNPSAEPKGDVAHRSSIGLDE